MILATMEKLLQIELYECLKLVYMRRNNCEDK